MPHEEDVDAVIVDVVALGLLGRHVGVLALHRPALFVVSGASPSVAFAMPKSSSAFTAPSYDIMMFDGETSRWIMPSGRPLLVSEACARS